MAARSPPPTLPKAALFSRSNLATDNADLKSDLKSVSSAVKVFVPAAIDKTGNIVAHNQLIRKAGLRSCIDNDGRLVNQVMPLHRRLCRINIRRGLEPGPRRP